MALVVLLRGVNVGGHRRLRPSALAKQLAYVGAVNIGAAGTLVIRRPGSRAALRADIARRLPFDAEIMIVEGREILRLLKVAQDHFKAELLGKGTVRFVSILARRPRTAPVMPLFLPSRRAWLLKILVLNGRFVIGEYRRHMKVIGYLGTIDRIFGASATTRGWSTLTAIARVLGERTLPGAGRE